MKTNGSNSNGPQKSVTLDELDKKILRYLQIDGKASLRDLSEKLGSSVSTIKSRLDRLIVEKVIKDTIALVDCCKVGYREMLIMSIRINTSVPINEIFEGLKNNNKINAIYQVSGNYPILCMAKCVEKEDEISLLEEIKTIKGIEEIITQVALQRIKEDWRIKIPD